MRPATRAALPPSGLANPEGVRERKVLRREVAKRVSFQANFSQGETLRERGGQPWAGNFSRQMNTDEHRYLSVFIGGSI
ncbi:MAG: hypothetical protein KME40_22795 [Komarekiella atlantica HA4396-MV6]|nr:hypothetical protein [Komarekiella atlantica HA4396-MV6]